jgi:MvaI/BcnI restriction endonuclease family
MKKESKKITFGDFSASEYIFSKNKPIICEFNNWTENIVMTREQFIKYFGNSNKLKHGRYSWSGKCVPTYEKYNDCGQKITIDEKNNICIFYRYNKDNRIHKKEYDYLKEGKILIVIWLKSKMEQHINKKFNVNGFFICKKEENVYSKICFGKAFDFSYFIENIKNKNIIFDSGMHCGNSRNYSQFRSSEVNFWDKLIVEEF